jgi:hypothetical protein
MTVGCLSVVSIQNSSTVPVPGLPVGPTGSLPYRTDISERCLVVMGHAPGPGGKRRTECRELDQLRTDRPWLTSCSQMSRLIHKIMYYGGLMVDGQTAEERGPAGPAGLRYCMPSAGLAGHLYVLAYIGRLRKLQYYLLRD